MKLTIIILLVAASHAAKVTNKERKEEFEKEKRGLEGNSSIEKRTPLLPSVSSSTSPGVEYADTKETHSDQSPTQQIYATPVPQAAKISDVLAQGPPFQSAIANQLYSPVSVYQSRFPTTYEVSQPVPSQLAYAEHSIQPQNIQTIPKANLPVNYQPQVFQQFETSPTSQQIPANYQQQLIQYNQQYNHDNQLQYIQEQPIQPQVTYARQEIPVNYQANYQTEQVKAEPLQQAISQNIQQAYTPQQTQGAVSYASFTQNQYEQLSQKVANQQPQSHYQPQQLIKYQLQHQPIQQAYRVQPQVQVQPQRYQQQQQYQQQYETPQYQIQLQPYQQYQQQYQIDSKGQQYQPQIQQVQLQQYQPQYVKSKQSEKQLYFKQLQQPQVLQPQPTVIQQVQPQQVTQSKLAQQYTQAPTQNLGYAGQVALPTFPPVQYFGKFAHSIFGQQ